MARYPFKLDFLKALTDDTGLLQHAKYLIPTRKEGYCTDDNARAIIVCTQYLNQHTDRKIKQLLETYLSFLLYMQREDGRLHNFLSYDRRFLDEVGSEDCMGHALWACGTCLDSNLPNGVKLVAKEVFDKALPWAKKFHWPRPKALTILGLYHYQKAYPTDVNVAVVLKQMADGLLDQYKAEACNGWAWFESCLTYANGRLPHALILAYENTGKQEYFQAAIESLDFLLKNQIANQLFIPIGNRGWYPKQSSRAVYDQQAIEASCMVEAVVAAYKATRERHYLVLARQIFRWFLGKNLNKAIVYDKQTGSCYDGITPEGVNLNRGAESMLAYLQAYLALQTLKQTPTTDSSTKPLPLKVRQH